MRVVAGSADTLDALGFDALARIYAWQAPPLAAARSIGIRLLDRLAPFKAPYRAARGRSVSFRCSNHILRNYDMRIARWELFAVVSRF